MKSTLFCVHGPPPSVSLDEALVAERFDDE